MPITIRWPLALACAATCLFASHTHAQPAQTADGAQSFLRTMAERGHARVHFIDALNRSNHVEGLHTVNISRIKLSIKEEETAARVERQLPPFVVIALGMGDGNGADACTTRIEGFKPPAELHEARSSSWEEPGFMISITVLKSETWDYQASFKRFEGAHTLDWRHSTVSRSNNGAEIHISAPGNAPFKTVGLVFRPDSLELADRIEYAAKFLHMSCDEAAGTGF